MTCALCGGTETERHCKIICTNCGAKRDCSDPVIVPPERTP